MTEDEFLRLATEATELLLGAAPLLEDAPSAARAVENISRQLQDGVGVVVAYGAYSSGKSTLLGSLLGIELPVSPTPTTAAPVRLRHGTKSAAEVRFVDLRLLGPLEDLGPAQRRRTLQDVLHLVDGVGREQVRVSALAAADASEAKLLSADDLRAAMEGQVELGANYLKIEFPKGREPESIDLGHDAGALAAWVAGFGLPLWIDEVVVTCDDNRLKTMELVDTPGVDSPVLGHRQVTERAIHGASCALFVFKGDHPDVHGDHRRVRRALRDALGARPVPVEHVATWADEGIRRAVDDAFEEDGVELTEAEARQHLKTSLALGLVEALGGGPPPVVHLMDARNAEDAGFATMWESIERKLASTSGPPRIEAARIAASDVLTPLQSQLEQLLADIIQRESRRRECQARLERCARVRSELLSEAETLEKRIDTEVHRLRQSALDNARKTLTDVPSCKKIANRWKSSRKRLSEGAYRRLRDWVERASDELSDLLARDVEPPSVPGLQRASVNLNAEAMEAELRGFGPTVAWLSEWVVPLRPSKAYVKKAQDEAVKQINWATAVVASRQKRRIAVTKVNLEEFHTQVDHLEAELHSEVESMNAEPRGRDEIDDLATKLGALSSRLSRG